MPALLNVDNLLQRIIAPNPPRYDLWPSAIQALWEKSGALVRCGPGFRGVGWPETPTVRLAALARWLEPNRIASHCSAAWVWGAARRPGTPLEISMQPGVRRPLVSPPSIRIRELRAHPHDLTTLGQFTVTTPQRTAIDLLYTLERFGTVEQVSCRLLAHLIDGGLDTLSNYVNAHRRPHRRLAQYRLASLMCHSSSNLPTSLESNVMVRATAATSP